MNTTSRAICLGYVLIHGLLPLVGNALSCPQEARDHYRSIAQRLDTSTIGRTIRSAALIAESDPEHALQMLAEVRAAQKIVCKGLAGQFHEAMARARWKRMELLKALDHCDSATASYLQFNQPLPIVRMKQLKGDILVSAGDFSTASALLEEALLHASANGNMKQMAAIRRSLGVLHYYQRQFSRAWEHYRASIDLFRAAGDQNGLTRTYTSMGILAAEDGEAAALESALAYCDTSLGIAAVLGDSLQMASAYVNMGLITMQMGDTTKARMHDNAALRIAQQLGDSLRMMKALENLGQLALRSKDYATTCNNCSLVLAFAKRHNMLPFERDAMRCLSDGYFFMGDWENAIRSLYKYNTLRDSTYNVSSREEILRRSLDAEAQRRMHAEQEAHRAQVRSVENEKLMLGAGALFLVVGGGVMAVYDRKRRRERFERDAARLQTQVLRTQMNPHFIFNALNSINNYVQENERDLASGFLTKFARLMRLVLENSRHNEVPLAQDLEALRLYMELEQSRMNGKFEFSIEVDPAVDQGTTLVPPLVVQPFVENAIWHGVSRREGKGHIKLIVRKDLDRLTMLVEDDGVGRGTNSALPAPDDAPPKTSLGTIITRDRLSLLGKQRDGEAGFRYTDLHQGTRVELTLPFQVAEA